VDVTLRLMTDNAKTDLAASRKSLIILPLAVAARELPRAAAASELGHRG